MTENKIRILVVDDEKTVCELLHDELADGGYYCATAQDAREAILKLNSERFDIALLDIRLPGISGMDLLRQIQSSHAGVTVIMVTAINDVDSAVHAMKLGAFDYIVKPFDLKRLHEAIAAALKSRQSKDDVSPNNELDAIAFGIEAKLDPLSNYSKLVVQETIDIARKLGIPENEIMSWITSRARLDSKKKTLAGMIEEKSMKQISPVNQGEEI